MTKKLRPIRICGDIAYVTLTRGHTAVIDTSDAAMVGMFNWYAMVTPHTVYAQRMDRSAPKRRAVLLHRTIIGEKDGLEVDHKDSDGLNNRRDNLREVTRTQNRMNSRIGKNNSSGFKGVYLEACSGKWRAEIVKNHKTTYLGRFTTPEGAHDAYCKASHELHGEFGRTE
jgi:hypothetical protein